MSQFPAFGLSNAIDPLSGDHRGLPTIVPLKDAKFIGLRPSRSQTQIPNVPERAELKTIFLPSGENCGSISGWVDAMNRVGALFLSDALGPGIRQMLESKELRA
jgi:hypothetical protein